MKTPIAHLGLSRNSRTLSFQAVLSLSTVVALSVTPGCTGSKTPAAGVDLAGSAAAKLTLNGPDERLVTILATNDIHGSVEPTVDKATGKRFGGMAMMSGVAKAIRTGLAASFGADKSAVLLVDGGDQFQGTLISNYNEGSLVFRTMNQAGYDAIIPGNHDYDFGPAGWTQDEVTPTTDQNPRGVIEGLSKLATFPMISANTYLKSSLTVKDAAGNTLPSSVINPQHCDAPVGAKVDFSHGAQPSFLKPYVIKEFSDFKVALIGIDNVTTPTTTSKIANVSDLCFRDEFEEYKEIRQKLEGQADVFVLIIHNGDSGNDKAVSQLVTKLNALPGHAVDAVIAGHTHYVHNVDVQGVHAIQSGANGQLFGRVDLIYNRRTGRVDTSRTQSYAGVRLWENQCDTKVPGVQSFCNVHGDGVYYENTLVVPDEEVAAAIATERQVIEPFAGRKLGTAKLALTVDRINESPLANALTDSFAALTSDAGSTADVVFMNTGGIRTALPVGDITYEQFYQVLPFNNHGVVLGSVSWQKLRALLERSIGTCGEYGALMQSGLKVTFSRDCVKQPNGSSIAKTKLLHVESVRGEILFDSETGITPSAERTFVVGTLDFLAQGGSGYVEFAGSPMIADLGVLRDLIADKLAPNPPIWQGLVEGRWFNLLGNGQ